MALKKFIKDTNGTLLENLIAFWKLNENSGSRKDSIGGNTLTDNASVLDADGLRGVAAFFQKASSEFLNVASTPDLQTGDIDFSVCGWVKLDSKGTLQTIISRWSATANQREYVLQYDSILDRFVLVLRASATQITVKADNFGSPSTGVWHFVLAWHDSVNNTANIQVNNGTVDSSAWSDGVQSGTTDLTVGATTAISSHMDGTLQNVGFWKKVLSSQERTDLFNGGNGNTVVPHIFFQKDTNDTLLTGLKAHYRLEEALGETRVDDVGGHDLKDNATVGQGAGIRNSAAEFVAANSEFLSAPDHPELSAGDIDFSIACWFKVNSFSGGNQFLIFKGTSGALADMEFALNINGSDGNNSLEILIGNGASGGVLSNVEDLSTGTFHFLIVWHDSVANTINYQLDGGSIQSTAYSGGSHDSTGALLLASRFGAVQFFDGLIDEVGYWKKVLTAQERSDLFVGGEGNAVVEAQPGVPKVAFDKDTGGTLLEGLKAFWKLDEASGIRKDAWGGQWELNNSGQLSKGLVAHWTLDEDGGVREDEVGGNDLADNATVTQAVGKKVKAAQFTKANLEFLSSIDKPDLRMGDIDFTFAGWVYLDSKPAGSMGIITKTGPSDEYKIEMMVPAIDRFQFRIVNALSVGTAIRADSFGSPPTGQFIFIVAWNDSVANTINIQINNGAIDSVAHAGGVRVGTNPFEIGRVDQPATVRTFDGRIDEVGIWKRVLTAQERTDLFNGGNGNSYSRASDLVDINTVTQAAGKIGSAAEFLIANTENLNALDNTNLRTGDIGFSFACWIRPDATGGGDVFASKGDTAGIREWSLGFDGASQLRLRVFNSSGTQIGVVTATTFGALSIGTFVFVQVFHDPVANTVGISINNGPVDQAATTGVPSDTASEFNFGFDDPSGARYSGRLDEFGFWKKVLIAQERTDLFNAGVGNTLSTAISASVSDTVTVVEDVTLILDLSIFVFEDLTDTVVEVVDMLLDNLFVVADEPFQFLITESVDVVDLVVEVGVTESSIPVSEFVAASLDILGLSADDTVDIAEECSESPTPTFTAFDPITMTELPAIEIVSDVLTLFLGASDTVAVAELGTIFNEAFVLDTVTVIEVAVLELSFLTFEVNDPITIADVAIMTDIVIELGPVIDAATATDVVVDILFANPAAGDDTITVVENIAILVFDLFLSVSDQPSIAEVPTLLIDVLFIDANDIVTTDDHGDIFPFVTVADVITAVEAPTLAVDLAVDVDELHFVVENVTLFDIVIELGIVFDAIAVADVFLPATFDLNLFVFEVTGSGITESVTMQLFFKFVNVSDTLGAPVEAVIVIIAFVVNINEPVSVEDAVIAVTVGNAAEGFDNVSAIDIIAIARDILFVSAIDTVTIVEDAILGLSVFGLFASDDVTVNDIAFANTELDLTFDDFLRSYPYVEDTIQNIRVEIFENGAEQRRDIWGRSRKRFRIEFAPRVKSEVDDLRSFYEAKSGPGQAFNFTNPLDNVARTVRFEENSLTISREAFGLFVARFVLVEVF